MVEVSAQNPSVQAHSGSSFYWALKLLPARKRAGMFAIYGFCRDVDDIADGTAPVFEKIADLEAHRSQIEALFSGQPLHLASLLCLKPVVKRFALDKADLLAVLDGMEMDALECVMMPDEATFDLYIDRVASAVGRLSNKVFGLAGPDAAKLAHHLGRALQITNILRDLKEDAERQRLYLPGDLLAAHDIAGETPAEVLQHANLEAVLRILASRAHWHFDQTNAVLTRLNASATKSPRLMQAVYSRILDRLEQRGLANVNQPVHLGKFEKLGLVLRYGLFG